MKVPDPIQQMKLEIGASKHIPITHLNTPTVFETASGLMGSTLKISGVSFDIEQDTILNQYKQTWHQALMALDSQYGLIVTIHRHSKDMQVQGEFENAFLRDLDTRYHNQFNAREAYVNDIYLTCVSKGITSGKVGKGLHLFNQLSNQSTKASFEHVRAERIKALNNAVKQVRANLAAFRPRLLGEGEANNSELMQYLSLLVNGGEAFNYQPSHFLPPQVPLSQSHKMNAQYPRGNLAYYLPRKRLFFGEYIQLQGAVASDKIFGAIVTIKQYPIDTASIMLDPLLHLNCHFIATHSYLVEEKDVALTQIERHMRRMRNVNDPAESQIDALAVAKDQLASGYITMGYHHNTLLLLSPTIEQLEQQVHRAIKCYADAGIVAVRETIGQEAAFWAQIPANHRYIARSAMITSENFVDFAPLHNYRTGFKDGNHLGSAVTLLETPSKTPYFFNYHVAGSRDNPSKGHATIIGGNNSGKTVLMTFMDAQLARYHGCSYLFDRDRGMEIYVRAAGGKYTIISPDFPDEIQFNPLQLPDTPINQQFCHDWLMQLCHSNDTDLLAPDTVEQLRHCIQYAYEQLATEHRYLSNIVQILPVDFPHWSALRRWFGEGEYAYLFDNPVDGLTLSGKMGFDMTHFLDKEPSSVRTAVLMYLFHRIDLSMNGQLVSIKMGEGWQYLDDPYWRNKLQRWLPTIRKRNGHMVLDTQSPSTVINSPIRHILQDNIATQIFFCNPQAKAADYIDGFSLTDSEFAFIKKHDPSSRLFLIKQENDSVVCRLNLGQLPDVLAVLSGNEKTVRLLDSIRAQVGDDPEDWLPVFHERRQSI